MRAHLHEHRILAVRLSTAIIATHTVPIESILMPFIHFVWFFRHTARDQRLSIAIVARRHAANDRISLAKAIRRERAIARSRHINVIKTDGGISHHFDWCQWLKTVDAHASENPIQNQKYHSEETCDLVLLIASIYICMLYTQYATHDGKCKNEIEY